LCWLGCLFLLGGRVPHNIRQLAGVESQRLLRSLLLADIWMAQTPSPESILAARASTKGCSCAQGNLGMPARNYSHHFCFCYNFPSAPIVHQAAVRRSVATSLANAYSRSLWPSLWLLGRFQIVPMYEMRLYLLCIHLICHAGFAHGRSAANNGLQ